MYDFKIKIQYNVYAEPAVERHTRRKRAIHCPGVLNVLPDALSRMYPDYIKDREFIPPTLKGKRYVARVDQPESGMGTSEIPRKSGILVDEMIHNMPLMLEQLIKERANKTVPTVEIQQELVAKCHDMHQGSEVMYKRLWYDGYYWPRMKQDCVDVTSSCLQCLRWNVGQHGFHPLKMIVAKQPFEHIAIDLADFSATPSEAGHTYALIVVDVFTKFVVLKPLFEKSSLAVARELYDIGNLVGHYHILQSDNGGEFHNSVQREYNRLMGSTHRFIRAYNPQANGVAENMVGQFKSILNKVMGGAVTQWHHHLSSIQYALNIHITKSNESSPFSLLYGRAVDPIRDIDGNLLPLEDNVLEAQSRGILSEKAYDALIERSRLMTELIYPEIHKVSVRNKSKVKEYAEKGRRIITKPLPLKSKVMLLNTDRNRAKNQARYFGPYTIVNFDSRNNGYYLQVMQGSLLERSFPVHFLKLIVGNVATFDEDGEVSAFEVEAVVSHRKGTQGQDEYLVNCTIT